MKKISEGIFVFVATIGKILIGVSVFVATFVADNISTLVVFMLALPLLIVTFSAGMSYMNTSSRKVGKTTRTAITTKGFNRQKYVADNLDVYGVSNIETSFNEREIHGYKYSRIGL